MRSTSFARSSFAAVTVGTLVYTLSGMCAAILAVDKLDSFTLPKQCQALNRGMIILSKLHSSSSLGAMDRNAWLMLKHINL